MGGNGDGNAALDRPVVTGTLYNESDTPPENVENDWVLQLPSGSDAKDSGVRVEIRQSSPAGFTVSLKGDRFKMEVQDDDPVMTLTVADAKVTIDDETPCCASPKTMNFF